jgi:Gluconate 2-dehydrogenase subunit 3
MERIAATVSKELPLARAKPPKVSRREMAQTLLSGLAGGALFPALSPLHAVRAHLLNGTLLDSVDEALALQSHRPLFLSAAQFAALDRIAEAIVPGSRKAQSAAFIDLLLSVDSEKPRQELAESLAALEAAANQTSRKSMVAMTDADLKVTIETAAVKDSPNYAHFENLKGWAVAAYYSSEAGMRELGWTPDRVFSSYPTCAHGESHS